MTLRATEVARFACEPARLNVYYADARDIDAADIGIDVQLPSLAATAS